MMFHMLQAIGQFEETKRSHRYLSRVGNTQIWKPPTSIKADI